MLRIKKYLLMFSIALGSSLLINSNVFAFNKVNVTRIYGQNRYETSAKIANYTMGYSSYAVLCNGDAYADSIVSSPIAYHNEAPILLVKRDTIPQEIKNQLVRLKTKKVIIMGGKTLISDKVEKELRNMGITVEARIAGKDRYETSALTSRYVISDRMVFLLYGDDWRNMLAVAPISAKKQIPMLLTQRGRLSDSVKQKNLHRTFNVMHLVTEKDEVHDLRDLFNQADIPFSVTTSGYHKTDTMFEVYNSFKNEINFSRVILASSKGYADGLCISPFSAGNGTITLYIDEYNYNSIRNFLYSHRSQIKDICVIGSEKAIPNEWVNKIKEDAELYTKPAEEVSERYKPLVVHAPKTPEQIEEDRKEKEKRDRLNKYGVDIEQAKQIIKDYVKVQNIDGFCELDSERTIIALEGHEGENRRIYWFSDDKIGYDLIIDKETGDLFAKVGKESNKLLYKLVKKGR